MINIPQTDPYANYLSHKDQIDNAILRTIPAMMKGIPKNNIADSSSRPTRNIKKPIPFRIRIKIMYLAIPLNISNP